MAGRRGKAGEKEREEGRRDSGPKGRRRGNGQDEPGKKVERQQKSIRRNVRLNERNVNHKKLRAFKSPTRWRTFALITLHLSFLPRPPSSWGGSTPCRPGPFERTPDRVRRIPPLSFRPDSNCVALSFFHLSFAFRENEYLLLAGLFPPSLPLSFSVSAYPGYLVPPLCHLPGLSLTHRNFSTANRSPSGSYALGDN